MNRAPAAGDRPGVAVPEQHIAAAVVGRLDLDRGREAVGGEQIRDRGPGLAVAGQHHLGHGRGGVRGERVARRRHDGGVGTIGRRVDQAGGIEPVAQPRAGAVVGEQAPVLRPADRDRVGAGLRRIEAVIDGSAFVGEDDVADRDRAGRAAMVAEGEREGERVLLVPVDADDCDAHDGVVHVDRVRREPDDLAVGRIGRVVRRAAERDPLLEDDEVAFGKAEPRFGPHQPRRRRSGEQAAGIVPPIVQLHRVARHFERINSVKHLEHHRAAVDHLLQLLGGFRNDRRDDARESRRAGEEAGAGGEDRSRPGRGRAPPSAPPPPGRCSPARRYSRADGHGAAPTACSRARPKKASVWTASWK